MINKVADHLLALPRPAKRLLALAVDTVICAMCVWLAFGLRLESWGLVDEARLTAVGVAVGVALPLFVVSGFYRAIFRYSGQAALIALVKACVAFGIVYFVLFSLIAVDGVPRSLGVNVPVLLFVMVGASRLLARYWLGGMYVGILRRKSLPQVVIYGAGTAGRQLASALANSREMVLRAFVDDSPKLHGASMNGLLIYAPSRLSELVHERGITDLLLAMPAVDRARRSEVVRSIQALKLPLHVRTLPDLIEMAQGKVHMQDLHELDIEDLLGRDPVAPNADLLHQNIRGKVVLVTGAGGSIGSELCRQIVRLAPHTLLLVEVSEYALYSIHHELQRKLGNTGLRILPLMASVRDEARMREIMRTWRPDTVYHAAAYKHVPLVEHNPAEGVRNNVLGTWVTARVAAECLVNDFVLISTDKAVRPTNIMGASKRLAEMVLQGLAQGGGRTRFSMVRFGNVLGSSGSVVPLFRQQIRDGGPITLTHADITRYFMTIPEAAQLVIQAGAMATGGDVFVLDMGAPVRIIDLARRMVELSGLSVRDEHNPDGDIAVDITGLRPGEKLYEELLIGDDPSPTQHPRIMKAHDHAMRWDHLQERLAALEVALSLNNVDLIRQILAALVSGYRPADEIVDWVHLKQLSDLVADENRANTAAAATA
ncbi:polysaccharide biosynthesis protein [Massilia niabensis]|uniref:Polysaccharide biosynthesis protein n=1 Tax=Massilia niabensis TaxID=544910 RepID=A0ABW0LB80_9BURK